MVTLRAVPSGVGSGIRASSILSETLYNIHPKTCTATLSFHQQKKFYMEPHVKQIKAVCFRGSGTSLLSLPFSAL